ncbi:hypothetical protein D3C76_1016540 [compost metagenome]
MISLDETAQDLGVEVTVVVCNECPGNPEDSGVTGQWPLRQLWQLAVVSGGKTAADLLDLGFDQMIIIEEPLSRMSQFAPLLQLGRAGPVGGEQDPLIFFQTAM